MGGRMGFVEKGEGKLRGWVRGSKEVNFRHPAAF